MYILGILLGVNVVHMEKGMKSHFNEGIVRNLQQKMREFNLCFQKKHEIPFVQVLYFSLEVYLYIL